MSALPQAMPVEPRSAEALVEIDDLTVDFWSGAGWANVVNGVTFSLAPGEALGLVGESGCGKTTTAFALLGYQRPNSRVRRGAVRFAGRDLLHLPGRQLRRVRGGQVALVPQNPTTALSPGIRVGEQLVETMAVHGIGGSRAERRERAVSLLRQVRLPEPVRSARKYPHQLSGGQQQRVTIAMALACDPRLLVLDEPTTGLDVTTQAQILDLLRRLREELGMALLYVTHNLGVVAAVCDRVGVMYAGELVEDAPTAELFASPRHPYTRGLIASVPSLAAPRTQRSVLLRGLLQRDRLPPGCRFAPRCDYAVERCFAEPQALAPAAPGHTVACWRWADIAATSAPAAAGDGAGGSAAGAPLLAVSALDCAYGSGRGLWPSRPPLRVVRNVSFDLREGETFSLVGESGSGKSTIARAVGGLLLPVAGTVRFDGSDVTRTVDRRTKGVRREIQLVLQNPDASLNPRQRVEDIVGRPLELFFGLRGARRRERVEALLGDVRLDAGFAARYPDELSGGERQRVAIARALAAEPRLVLCDEVLSALDVSVQSDVIDLLRALQVEHRIAYLFISHDLAVVRSLSHRVGVLYLGELCEVGGVEEVYNPPFHPYTAMLLSAVPEIGGTTTSTAVRGDPELDSPASASACPFAHRCQWKVGSICDEVEPPWQETVPGHALRCHIPLDELRTRSAEAQASSDA